MKLLTKLLSACVLLAADLLAPTAMAQPPVATSEAPQPVAKFEVVKLQNAEAIAAVGTIAGLLGREGPTVTADAATNSILLRGSDAEIEMVKRIVKQLDTPRTDDTQDQKDDDLILNVFELKFAEARSASTVLENILRTYEIPVRITAEQRLNRIFASYPEAMDDTVRALVKEIDVQDPGADSKVMPLSGERGKDRSLAQLMSGVANDTDVKIEYIPEINVAVVRGKKEAVSTFTQRYEELVKTIAVQGLQETAETTDYIVSAVWLVSGESASTIPPRYDVVVRRAGEFGITNLKLAAQLMARTSVRGSGENTFEVMGHADMDKTGCQVTASGDLSRVAGGSDSLLLNVELSVKATSDAENKSASSRAAVQMRLAPGQPAIIASAPVAGRQSLFVIEVNRD